MVDDSDGTYSHSFSVDNKGVVTLAVFQLELGIVEADYFNGISGTFLGQENHTEIDESWKVFDIIQVLTKLERI